MTMSRTEDQLKLGTEAKEVMTLSYWHACRRVREVQGHLQIVRVALTLKVTRRVARWAAEIVNVEQKTLWVQDVWK